MLGRCGSDASTTTAKTEKSMKLPQHQIKQFQLHKKLSLATWKIQSICCHSAEFSHLEKKLIDWQCRLSEVRFLSDSSVGTSSCPWGSTVYVGHYKHYWNDMRWDGQENFTTTNGHIQVNMYELCQKWQYRVSQESGWNTCRIWINQWPHRCCNCKTTKHCIERQPFVTYCIILALIG